MARIRLGLVFCSVFMVSVAARGCEPAPSTPDILAPLERAVTIRDSSPGFSLESNEMTAASKAVLENLADLRYVIDVSAYASLPPSILAADLASLADAVAEVDMPSRARIERWSIDPGDGVAGEYSLPLYPYRGATVRFEGQSPLPIVLLPRFADLDASTGSGVPDDNMLKRAIATSRLWAAALYFLPQKKRIVWYRCAMPSTQVKGQVFPPKGGPEIGRIGKIVGCPDDNTRENGFRLSAEKIERQLSSDEALGIVITGELTPDLWAFAAWEADDAEGHATQQGFAVPLLDGNGAMRGTSFFDVTPTRGSAFENLVLDVPENLTWGRHVLYKLPRPMALARYGMPEEMRARTHLEERIVALIPSDETLVPSVQAFVKAETWGPFAEDVVLTANPTAEQLASGAVRALAISASIDPDDLRRLLAAMAGPD